MSYVLRRRYCVQENKMTLFTEKLILKRKNVKLAESLNS